MIPAGFFTAPSLVTRLRKAKHDNRLDTEPETIGKAEPPVIDELGYLPGDIEGARLLFQVIADSYETRSVGVRPGPGIRQMEATCSATATWPPRSSTASSTTAGSSVSTANPTAAHTHS